MAPVLAGLPHRLDPHAHPHFGGVDLLNQVQERDIRAVEQHVGRDVRGFDALAGERDVDDRERRHSALVRQFDEVVGRLAGGRIGFPGREVQLAVLAGAGTE